MLALQKNLAIGWGSMREDVKPTDLAKLNALYSLRFQGTFTDACIFTPEGQTVRAKVLS